MRVLVIGSGLAGLFAAVRAADAGHEVQLVTKGALAASNTAYAQGGIAAALFPDDSTDSHMLDTLAAGDGICDVNAVRVLVDEGPARVRDLIRFGVRFDSDGAALARGLEAAHVRARVLHAGGDATGAAIEQALIASVRARAVQIFEHTMLLDLLTDAAGAVTGATLLPTSAEVPTRFDVFADAVILATGGAGQLYAHTTNPAVATADGVAAAWRAGAQLADLEFVQFHPTALAIPGTPLVSEAVRGEGAVLVNERGERFMLDVHPLAELAPRDVVARAIAVEMAAQGGVPVRLDATAIGRTELEHRFPTITAATRAAGYDWASSPVPVSPAAHYWMGGIATDLDGATSLAGLFAIGECACTGVHGANRLASNSLLEAAVFADRAVRALPTRAPVPISGADGRHADAAAPEPGASHPNSADSHGSLRSEIQAIMWENVGVLRTGDRLRAAVERLDALERPDTAAGCAAAVAETANLLDVARLVARAALAREESRGAHFRADFPSADPGLAGRVPAREDAIAC
ncbi:L-aspartate oxidase [Rathayibacter sp. YIM 133350]|uniref:L-aspartate oxidase n=1 Tax=Rathayibacter sp. YIM 133350 TaxID=3131992 RepID=UPI00307CD51C